MEDKKEIVLRLKLLLKATRAGKNIADLILHENQEKITILFRAGGTRVVDITADSGYGMIRDVLAALG